ncbi:MAG: response regulator [Verrucomicrobiales bacterium]|nr:response regulator [Verrucomicrobiales bacterium]
MSSARSTPRPPTVLIADDDAAVRESLSRLLRAEGYEVRTAPSGAAVLELMQQAPEGLDLALLDLNMPGKNGWATLDRLFETRPGLPVVILTGLPNQRPLAEATGVRALVEKPVPVEALLQLLEQLLAEGEPGRPETPVLPAFRHLRPASTVVRRYQALQSITPYTPGGLNE